MANVQVQGRVGLDVKLNLVKLGEQTGLSKSALIEELLGQALSGQDSELATTFLIPKLEAMVEVAVGRHFEHLAKLQTRAAIDANTSVTLLMGLYQLLNPKADDAALHQIQQGARRMAYDSLTRRSTEVEALLSADVPARPAC
ncbi:hypothetical protein GO986_12705 [Deinococcus sp. HMF7620]|uniref:Uncharacterized protein n=1 Tax=Deinococcus arboris TaxID=2682977 RepID=A0A7C9HSK3_9DEIO|nr:hypothetical protein [Deinococcus arboris]MVN87627.1 hypothetical protein [Deinococcus arboris]